MHAAYGNFRGGEGEPAPEEPTAAAQDEGAYLKLRDDGGYRRLAAQIVKSQAAAPSAADEAKAVGFVQQVADGRGLPFLAAAHRPFAHLIQLRGNVA